jgi:hypothetical protein
MSSRSRHLPSRFPVGTKFVIEGRRAGEGQVQVFRRFIEFPDGTHLRLPRRPDKRKSAALMRRASGPRRSANGRGARLGA